jgi:hypothetical protein
MPGPTDLDQLVAAWDAVDPQREAEYATTDYGAGVTEKKSPALISPMLGHAQQMELAFRDKYPQAEGQWDALKAKRYPWTGELTRVRGEALKASLGEGGQRAFEQGMYAKGPVGAGLAELGDTLSAPLRGAAMDYLDPTALLYGKQGAQGVRNAASKDLGWVGRGVRGALHLGGELAPISLAGKAVGAGLGALSKAAPVVGAALRAAPAVTAIGQEATAFGLEAGLRKPGEGETRAGNAATGFLTGGLLGASGVGAHALAGKLFEGSAAAPLYERLTRAALSAATGAAFGAGEAALHGGSAGDVARAAGESAVTFGLIGAGHSPLRGEKVYEQGADARYKAVKLAQQAHADAMASGQQESILPAKTAVAQAKQDLVNWRNSRDRIVAIHGNPDLKAISDDNLARGQRVSEAGQQLQQVNTQLVLLGKRESALRETLKQYPADPDLNTQLNEVMGQRAHLVGQVPLLQTMLTEHSLIGADAGLGPDVVTIKSLAWDDARKPAADVVMPDGTAKRVPLKDLRHISPQENARAKADKLALGELRRLQASNDPAEQAKFQGIINPPGEASEGDRAAAQAARTALGMKGLRVGPVIQPTLEQDPAAQKAAERERLVQQRLTSASRTAAYVQAGKQREQQIGADRESFDGLDPGVQRGLVLGPDGHLTEKGWGFLSRTYGNDVRSWPEHIVRLARMDLPRLGDEFAAPYPRPQPGQTGEPQYPGPIGTGLAGVPGTGVLSEQGDEVVPFPGRGPGTPERPPKPYERPPEGEPPPGPGAAPMPEEPAPEEPEGPMPQPGKPGREPKPPRVPAGHTLVNGDHVARAFERYRKVASQEPVDVDSVTAAENLWRELAAARRDKTPVPREKLTELATVPRAPLDAPRARTEAEGAMRFAQGVLDDPKADKTSKALATKEQALRKAQLAALDLHDKAVDVGDPSAQKRARAGYDKATRDLNAELQRRSKQVAAGKLKQGRPPIPKGTDPITAERIQDAEREADKPGASPEIVALGNAEGAALRAGKEFTDAEGDAVVAAAKSPPAPKGTPFLEEEHEVERTRNMLDKINELAQPVIDKYGGVKKVAQDFPPGKKMPKDLADVMAKWKHANREAVRAKAALDAARAALPRPQRRVEITGEAAEREANRSKFGGATTGWKRGSTKIGKDALEVTGLESPSGRFLVHKTPDRKSWTITHLPTGLAATREASNAENAKIAVARLEAIEGADWSKSDQKAIGGDEVMGQAAAIARNVNDPFAAAPEPLKRRGEAGMVSWGANRHERRAQARAYGGDAGKAEQAWKWRNVAAERPDLARQFKAEALGDTLEKLRSQGLRDDEIHMAQMLESGADIDDVHKASAPNLTKAQFLAKAQMVNARLLDAADQVYGVSATSARQNDTMLRGTLRALADPSLLFGGKKGDQLQLLTRQRLVEMEKTRRAKLDAWQQANPGKTPPRALRRSAGNVRSGLTSVRTWLGDPLSNISAEVFDHVFQWDTNSKREYHGMLLGQKNAEKKLDRLSDFGGSGIKGLHDKELSTPELWAFDLADGGRRINRGQEWTPEQAARFKADKIEQLNKWRAGAGRDWAAAVTIYQRMFDHVRRRYGEVYGRDPSTSISEFMYASHLFRDESGNPLPYRQLSRVFSDPISAKMHSRFELARGGAPGYVPDLINVGRAYFPGMMRKISIDELLNEKSPLTQIVYGDRTSLLRSIGRSFREGAAGGTINDSRAGQSVADALNGIARSTQTEKHRDRLFAWIPTRSAQRVLDVDGQPLKGSQAHEGGYYQFALAKPVQVGDRTMWLKEARIDAPAVEVPITAANIGRMQVHRGGLLDGAVNYGQQGRLEEAVRWMHDMKLGDKQGFWLVDNALSKFTRTWIYNSTLGLGQIKPVMNNLAGGMFMLTGTVGLKPAAEATARMVAQLSGGGDIDTARLLTRLGVLEEKGAILEGRGSVAGSKFQQGLQTFERGSFAAFEAAEKLLRGTAGLAGYERAKRYSDDFINRLYSSQGIRKDEMLTQARGKLYRADGSELPGGEQLMDMLDGSKLHQTRQIDKAQIDAELEGRALLHGRATVAKTQFLHGAAFTPRAFNNPYGRLIFQLNQYPLRAAMSFFDATSNEKDPVRVARWLALGLTVSTAAHIWDRDLSSAIGPRLGDVLHDETWDAEGDTAGAKAKRYAADLNVLFPTPFSQGAPYIPLASVAALVAQVGHSALGMDPSNPLPDNWTTDDLWARAGAAWDNASRQFKSSVRPAQWAHAMEFLKAPEDAEGRRQVSYVDKPGYVTHMTRGEFASQEVFPGSRKDVYDPYRREMARADREGSKDDIARRYRDNAVQLGARDLPRDQREFIVKQQAQLLADNPFLKQTSPTEIAKLSRMTHLSREVKDLTGTSLPERVRGYFAWKQAEQPDPSELRDSLGLLFGDSPKEFSGRFKDLAKIDRASALKIRAEWSKIMSGEPAGAR